MKTNYNDLKNNELLQLLNDYQKELQDLRFQKILSHLDNPAQYKITRRNVARVKTVLTQRGIKA